MSAKKYNGWYKVTKNTRFKEDQKYFIWTKEYGIDIVKYDPYADIEQEGYNLYSVFNDSILYNLKGVDYWRYPILGPDGKEA